jgi:hypothetical protein
MRSPIDSAKGTTRTNVPSRRFPTATRAEPTTRPRIPGGGGTHHTLSLAEFPGLPSYRTDGQGQKGAGPRFLWSGGRAAYLGVSGCDGCRSVGKQVGIHGGKVGVERTATAPLTEGPAHPRVQGYGCAHLRPSSWPHGIQGKGKTLACGDLARPMRQRGRRAPLNSNQRIWAAQNPTRRLSGGPWLSAPVWTGWAAQMELRMGRNADLQPSWVIFPFFFCFYFLFFLFIIILNKFWIWIWVSPLSQLYKLKL